MEPLRILRTVGNPFRKESPIDARDLSLPFDSLHQTLPLMIASDPLSEPFPVVSGPETVTVTPE